MSLSHLDNSRCLVSIDTRFLFDLRRSLSSVYTRWACTVSRRRATYIGNNRLLCSRYRRSLVLRLLFDGDSENFSLVHRWRWWRWIKDDGSSLLSSHFPRVKLSLEQIRVKSIRGNFRKPSISIVRQNRFLSQNCLLMLPADQPWNAHHLMNYWKQGGREERDERSIT